MRVAMGSSDQLGHSRIPGRFAPLRRPRSSRPGRRHWTCLRDSYGELPVILTSLDEVRPGMMLGTGVHNPEGQTLLGPEVPLTAAYIGRLQALGCSAVWIDDEDTRDIPFDHLLSEGTRLAAARARSGESSPSPPARRRRSGRHRCRTSGPSSTAGASSGRSTMIRRWRASWNWRRRSSGR